MNNPAKENPTQQNNATNPPSPDGFFQLWSKFYAQTLQFSTSIDNANNSHNNNDEDGNAPQRNRNQRIIVTFETMTKLIFGLDGPIKSKVVLHGIGALELIVALAKSSDVFHDPPSGETVDEDERERLVLGCLKAIKTCVIRNASGRCRCRSAGVLGLLNLVFDRYLVVGGGGYGNAPLVVEEALTTLAAVCLGDDLNALQAAILMQSSVSKAENMFPNESSMRQKITYLNALFQAVNKEQTDLIQSFRGGEGSVESLASAFFDDVTNAEMEVRTGYGHLQNHKFTTAEKHYNHAMTLIRKYTEPEQKEKRTNLLDTLACQILENRAVACLETGNIDQSLEDVNNLFEFKLPLEMRVKALKMQAKIYEKLGKIEDAKESLGKAKILCPQDEEVIANLELLCVS